VTAYGLSSMYQVLSLSSPCSWLLPVGYLIPCTLTDSGRRLPPFCHTQIAMSVGIKSVSPSVSHLSQWEYHTVNIWGSPY